MISFDWAVSREIIEGSEIVVLVAPVDAIVAADFASFFFSLLTTILILINIINMILICSYFLFCLHSNINVALLSSPPPHSLFYSSPSTYYDLLFIFIYIYPFSLLSLFSLLLGRIFSSFSSYRIASSPSLGPPPPRSPSPTSTRPSGAPTPSYIALSITILEFLIWRNTPVSSNMRRKC